jgi:hypothetical protein
LYSNTAVCFRLRPQLQAQEANAFLLANTDKFTIPPWCLQLLSNTKNPDKEQEIGENSEWLAAKKDTKSRLLYTGYIGFFFCRWW